MEFGLLGVVAAARGLPGGSPRDWTGPTGSVDRFRELEASLGPAGLACARQLSWRGPSAQGLDRIEQGLREVVEAARGGQWERARTAALDTYPRALSPKSLAFERAIQIGP